MSPSCMISLSNELRTATNPGICHMCADPGQKIGTSNNVKNIALVTSLVIRRSRTGVAKLFQQGILTKKIMTVKG